MHDEALQRLHSFFSLAVDKFKRGNTHAGHEYIQRCRDIAENLEFGPQTPSEVLSKCYLVGAYEAVLSCFQQCGGKGASGDMLPIMACGIYASRGEPHEILKAAKHIANVEQRRLRQKSAELWKVINTPLTNEPSIDLLVLTYNREAYVEQSLRQLGKTLYKNYRVFIADNGSTDKTWEIVQHAKDFFPANIPVQIQRFPTNIGRPAGHNWLLTEMDHGDAEYIAIGDDDLIDVPTDWLHRMIQTMKAIPDCACVGGKAISPGWPESIHAGIRNIIGFDSQGIHMTNDGECYDVAQFDYVDIVDHVIGCLHIFDRRSLEQAGLFDIRFTPCQMVDIEHHLRMRLAGVNIAFNGFIKFTHLRGMGKAVGNERALLGNSLGNMLKLMYKYSEEEVCEGIARRHEERNAWLMV